MTREEAIFCEKSYLGETNCIDCNYYGTDSCKSRESHRMAIKALEQEPTTLQQIIKKHNMVNLAYDEMSDFERDVLKYAEQELSVDKIRAEIAEYGSIMVTYAITNDTKTDKGIEKLVSDVLQQAKEEVLQIIDKHKAESED